MLRYMVNNICDIESESGIEDIFGNNRLAMKVPYSSDARRKANILFDDRDKDINSNYFKNKLKEIDISVIDSAVNHIVEDYFYDCRDWVFDKVGLSPYTWRDGIDIADKLINKDLPGLSWVHPSSPEKSIVMYLSPNREPSHWGVIVPDKKEIIVDSKWGKLDVYRHPLETVPYSYGNNACFFKINSCIN